MVYYNYTIIIRLQIISIFTVYTRNSYRRYMLSEIITLYLLIRIIVKFLNKLKMLS